VAVLGLILLVAAGALTAAVVTSNTGAIDVDLWGVTISNLSLGVIFVAGMLTTLVGVAGIILMMGGLRRGRRLRRERRVLRRENERLAQQAGPVDAEGEAEPYSVAPEPQYSGTRYTEPAPRDGTPPPDGSWKDRRVATRTGGVDSTGESTDAAGNRYEAP
jgi:hypothetical protein